MKIYDYYSNLPEKHRLTNEPFICLLTIYFPHDSGAQFEIIELDPADGTTSLVHGEDSEFLLTQTNDINGYYEHFDCVTVNDDGTVTLARNNRDYYEATVYTGRKDIENKIVDFLASYPEDQLNLQGLRHIAGYTGKTPGELLDEIEQAVETR